MKMTRVAIPVILLCAMPALAHRLDEYLQATLISVEKNRVQAQIRLTPGVAVFPIVFANIDTNADGVISEAEQRDYARHVLRDLSLTADARPLKLRLLSAKFPQIEEMKNGMAEIQLEFDADIPQIGGTRRLIFENRHQAAIGAYLVNALVPGDPDIHLIAQNRNYQQSFYQLDYVQAGWRLSSTWWSGGSGFLAILTGLLFARFAWLWRRQQAA
jgi:hypothetical protein